MKLPETIRFGNAHSGPIFRRGDNFHQGLRLLKKVLAFRATLWLRIPFLAMVTLVLETSIGENQGMKEKIHPKYQDTTITCICGNVVHTRSTAKDMQINTCSATFRYDFIWLEVF